MRKGVNKVALRLFEHNEKAYHAAVWMMEQYGKAAIVHPTGTGKSYIAFKLIEDNPEKVVIWLSPSEYIFKTQLESLKRNDPDFPLANVHFYTYAKLMCCTQAQLDDIAAQKPAYIILDEFHRAGAECWGESTVALLKLCPDARLLGLTATNIRYLDNNRDMAEELFDSRVASDMTLGEAIVRGILPAPNYVTTVYQYQKDLARYQTRVDNLRSPGIQDVNQKYLDALRRALECIILSVNDTYMDAQEVMHMTDYSKITALYSRLSVGDEDRDGGESNSIQNQKIFLENYAKGQHLTNIRHYIDDDESGRFFDRSAYSRMIEDVESGKIGVCIMKDLTRWGRDYLQVGNAMEIFRRNNVRFIAVNNGIDSEKPDTLEFAPFINIMSEWYAKDISKKVKTGIKTKGMSGKPIVTEAPYGYIKAPDNKDFWIIDEEAAEVVRLIFRLFLDGKNRNQIAVYLTQEQIPSPTFYMKDRGRGTCKNKTLNEDNRCKWNKVTLTNILTRQEYCGDVVNFKTTKHFRDKHNHYVDRSQWHITENVHEPIISRSDFETVQRILENAPVRRPNGDGEIHPLSGLLFCKDCGAKMHIRIDYRNGGKRHVAFCSEYHKGKSRNPKCNSPHIMDADLLMQTIAEVLKKIEDYSISNRAEFEALVKKNLAMQQTDQTKKQQKRIPQITTRLEQIDKVLNKLYEDNALGTISQDRYEQMSKKYSEEYYALKAELATLQEQLSAYENAGGRAQKFLKLTERHAAFTDLTPAILNEFISRIEVHERDQKRARYAIQHISIYFNYIGKFENELTQLAEPTEQEIRQMREEIEEAKKEKSRAYHRQYSREYRARNLEKQREYDRMKAREYRARRKAQAAAAQPTQ